MEDRYFRAEEVARYLSMGLSTVWVKSKDVNDDFPNPRKISARISVFKKSELDDWANRNTVDVAEKK
jgi:predicted DNA-binding transcriptional regulator AlpA